MTFEWDREKNTANKKKHGISFETAVHVFEDENYIEIYDYEHSSDEDRYMVIGLAGELLVVVYTERSENIRIISARFATGEERRIYYDSNL